jgi:large repetitive protein
MPTEHLSPRPSSCLAVLAAAFVFAFAMGAPQARAQVSTAGVGVVRHGVVLSGSNRVEGSLQILAGENTSFDGTPIITGDLLVPGTPLIQFGGNPSYGGTLQGAGDALPSNYQITGNGHFSLRHIVLRTNAVAMPVVAAPPLPAGTRDVALSSSGANPGSFATIRNLTVSGAAGNVVVPPGTYGAFAVTGNNSLTLGVAGATQPAVYNFQALTFSGKDDLRIVGPVIVTVNGSVTCGGRIGSSASPGWLKLRVASGNVILSGNNTIYGQIIVPNGSVTFNGNSELIGGLACNQLILNGNNLLRFLILNTPPAATNDLVTTNEDTDVSFLLRGTDPDNNPLTYTLLSVPLHGRLSGVAPQLQYTPEANYNGSDSFTFKVNDGQADSNVATITLAVTPVNDTPTAISQRLTTKEDQALAVTVAGQDVDEDALTYEIISGPTHGTLTGTPPQLLYTPDRDSNATDQFSFVVNDGKINSGVASVVIVVDPTNDAPIAVDSSIELLEDTPRPVVLGATDPDGDVVTYPVITKPQHGKLSGTPPNLTYTPDANYAGPDSFNFSASDGQADSALATVSINVIQVNDAPEALEQNVSTTEDTPRRITLSGKDTEGDPLGYRVDQLPAHGTLEGTPPDLIYKPAPDYNGSDSFTFVTNDSFEESDAATVTITIVPANDAPVAAPQQLNTPEDTELEVTLGASDAEGDALTYTIVRYPQNGSLSGSGSSYTYKPAPNYFGTDSFAFRANDGQADSNEAVVDLTIAAVNDSPVADKQSVTTDEDVPRAIVLTGSDVDGDALSFRVLSGPENGVLEGTAPQFTYRPRPNYNGPDTVVFVTNDGHVDSAPATVSISVGPINDAPVTYDDEVATDEDVAMGIVLWANEYDGDPLTFTVTTQPQHGTISGSPPNLLYTPDQDFHGSDSFAFKANDGLEDSNVSTVAITVRSINDVPVASSQHRLTPEDSPLEIALSAADADSDPLTYTVLTPPAHGTLGGTPPNLLYTPAQDFYGEDAFTFRVNDGTVDSAPATVAITVQPVNDLPEAVGQPVSTDEEVPVPVTLAATDVDGDPLVYLILTPPEHGTLTGTPPNLVYTPTTNYNGPDRIVFAAYDGTSDSLPAEIQITVRPLNDAPAAVGQSLSTAEDTALAVTLTGTDADNDTLTYSITVAPQHGSLSGVPPDVTYIPAADFNGTDSFAFKANDGTVDSPPANIHIAVTPVNDAPSATAQGIVTDQNTASSVTLAGTDVDQDLLTFSIVTPPGHGVISGTSPNLTYTPADNYHGPDSFTFRANDGALDSAPATVSITVNRVNRRPVAADQMLTTDEDTPKVVILSGTDPDGDPLTYVITGNPAHGRLVGSGATLTYRPNSNYSGPDSFTFKVNDGVVDSLPGTIAINISSVNDAPTAIPQTIATKKDQARSFTLTASDPDGDPIAYSVLESPAHGTLTGAAPDLTYTPASGYLGADHFTFKVNDGQVDSAPATVSINVNSNNTAPSALPQSVATDEDNSVNITLTATDAEGNTLSYLILSQPAHGVLTGTPPALTYTPAENYNGADHFSFQASDGSLASDPANVSITVRPVNDAPVAEAQSIRTKQAVSKSFVLNGTDIDGDALTYTVTVAPAHGTLSGAAPNLTYIPESTYFGADSLKFTISDGHAISNEATVGIKITPPIVSRTYTTTADFAEGSLFNVNSAVPNQLQTSINQSNFDFVWIPIFTKGTVVRLDTETGRVLGEYRLTPDGVGDPYASRTAIDSKGNCWIANERTNTVVMIANPNGADWIDKNHNGKLDTSIGQDDIKPWPNPNGVNTNGGVSAAEDELIVRYVKSTATNLRHISVDGQDNVWVGGVGVQNFDLIDHNTGTIIRTELANGRGGNGGFIDFDNVLWSTGRFLRWQANLPLSSVPPTPWNIPDNSWGVAKDPLGNVWVTYDPSEVVYKYAPDGHLIGTYPHGSTWSQGLAIDANGDVWIATSHCGYFVSHLKNDGTFVGAVPVAAHGPTGVAIDRKGYIWVSNTNGVVQRINPLGGAVGRDGVTPIGEVDITTSYLGGTIWAYSNFTGAALARAGQRGRWTVTYDSEQDGANWGAVVWNAQICNDGALPVYASVSEDGIHYSAEQLLTPENSVPTAKGRFITIRVDFEPSESGGVSPILQDITVGTAGYVPPPVGHGWSITAGDDINANWPDPLVLHGAICRSAYDPAVNSSVTWSVVSGPGQVSFSDIHAIQPTCQFTKDGIYVFRVTALVGSETQTDDLTVRLTPYNKAPWVDAGPNRSIRTIASSAFLDGTVRDDGLPENTPLQIQWRQKYGPGVTTFANPNSPTTTATFSMEGIYTLELWASDGQYSATATVEVRAGTLCSIEGIDGLVSWWQANGTAADHASGNQAFLEKGATYQNSLIGAGFKFDGTDDRITVFKSPSLDLAKTGDGSLTVEFWMKPETHENNFRFLAEWKNVSTDAYGVHIYRWFSQLRANLVDTQGRSHEIFSNADVAFVGQWTHIGVTYDGTTGVARIYVNGVQQTSANLGLFTPQTSYDLYFGSDINSSGNAVNAYYSGMLDEISLYRRALDGNELHDIYAAGSDGKCPIDENHSPVVDAGPDQSIARVDDTVALHGSATDDGLPVDSSVALLWTKLSGPGTVTFSTPSSVATLATFSAPGVYILQLMADDGLDKISDTVVVRVGTFCRVEGPAGLAAWWPGNGDAHDVISGQTGRLLNGASFVDGKVSMAFQFDGANDAVRNVAAANLDLGKRGDGSLTIEFWMRPETHENNFRMLTQWRDVVTGRTGVHVYRWFSQLRANLIDTQGRSHEIFSNADVALINLWTHIGVTYDGKTGIARIYVNGVQQSSAPLGIFTPQTSYDLYFGSDLNSAGPANPFYKGQLDEISLYSRSLDGQEMWDIFAAGQEGKCPTDQNRAPVVNAGPNQSLTRPGSTLTLSGVVTDDGLPLPSSLNIQWKKLSGPGDVLLGTPNQSETTATFSQSGIYVMELSANDTLDHASDTVEVRVNAFCSVDSPPDLAAWWPANGDALDVISGHVGRLLNGVTFADGKASMGFKFDGSDDVVRIAADDSINIAKNGSFTVEFWMNPETHENNFRMLTVWKNAVSGAYGVHIYRWFSQLRANLIDTSGLSHEIFSNADVAFVNQWTHVAVTYDKPTGIARIYINGNQQASANLGVFTPQTTPDLYFGDDPSSNGSTNSFYKGMLDEISLYRRALDGKEIHDIYAADTDGKCPIDDNAAPIVDAGPDQSVTQTSGILPLQGSVIDDGLPAGSSVGVEWSKVSGPGVVTFANASSATTTATFSQPGIYVLQLVADDSLDQGSDTVEVRVGTYCRVEGPAGLTSWWPGNGDARDVIGGQTGRLLNGASFVDGKVSMAFQFDGVNDAVRNPASPNLDVGKRGDGSFSIEFWMKPETHENNFRFLAEWRNAATGATGVHVYRWFSQLRANLIDTNGLSHEIFSNADVAFVNQWTHVAVTYDKPSGIARIYINGVQQTAAPLGAFTPQTSYDLYFGSDLNSAGPANPFYKGQLDEISLYSRALDGQELWDIFSADKEGKCPVDQNRAPTVSAGPDLSISQASGTVALLGSVDNDSLPLNAGTTLLWRKLSGPGDVTFADSSSAQTTATFSAPGIYVLQLTADDTLNQASDTMEVRVGVPCRIEGPADMAAWWPGNGDAKDVVSGQVGRLLNGVSLVDAKVSMGFQFDGANDSVRMPAATNLDVAKAGDGSMTVEFWMKPDTHENNFRFLVEWKNTVNNAYGVHIYRWFSQLRANFIDTTGLSHEIFSNADVAFIGQWTHVAVTYDKTKGIARIYINGVQQSSANLGIFTPQTSYDLYFGSDLTNNGSANSFYKGQLDEIALYRRALDGQELWDIFAADKDGKCPFDQNRAPVVNAGPDQAVAQTNTAINLHGTVSDDGLPLPASINAHWSKVSGPGSVSFGNADSLDTTASFDLGGIYVLRLTADDTLESASDLVEVRVGPACGTASASSLVAWWPGNGDAQDVVTGQFGRLLNGTSFVDAKVSTGFKFDGADDAVRMPAAANLDVAKSGDGSVSLEFWMNPETHENNFRFLAEWKNVATGAYGVHVYRWFSQLRVNWIDTAGNAHNLFSNADVAFVGQWTHVAVTYDHATGTGRIYINGVQQSSASLGVFLPQTSHDLYFASDLGSAGPVNSFYKGQLDEVGLYNTSLTAAQVQAIYAAGVCGKTPFVRNAPPSVNAGYDRTITLPTNSVTLAGTALDDGNPANSALTVNWTQTAGPATALLSSPTSLQTTAMFSQTGDYTFQLTASDGALSASSLVHVTVLPDLRTPPVVSLTAPAGGSRFQSTQAITISASASDNDGRVTKVEFFADAVKLGEKLTTPYSYAWSNAPGGSHVLTARATDNDGLTATSSSVNIDVVDPSTAPPPRIELTSPEDASAITAPTEIRGSVEMASLKSWRLEYQLQGTPCADWVTFATGTGQVHDNVIGTLDPTLLLNGTYVVRLVVTDLANVSRTPNYLTFFIDGNMKVGQFTATFKDLELPLSGVPITVTRTYDSRNHCPGDFGYGWSLDVDSIRLESTEQMGNAWDLFVFVGNLVDPSYYRMDDAGPHLLSVKLPDGQLLRFTPKIVMDRPYNRLLSLLDQDGDDIGQVISDIQYNQPVKLIYRAQSGTNGAVLKPRGYHTTDDLGGSGSTSADAQFYLSSNTEGAFGLATHENSAQDAPLMTDVTGWELTLKDGRVFLFDASGKLEQMLDRVGNKVTFNRDGAGKVERITHSPSAKEIVFTRDASQRIKAIADPAGNKVQYRYTTNGDLDAVFQRGNDPAANVPTTSFTYKGVTHLLENILDARGIQAAKNYYDDAGRLIKTVDADGKETIFTHDLNSRTETIKDRAGNITVHKYDERGNIIETHAPDGTVTATDYHRWSDGKLSDLKETESVTGLFTDEFSPTAPLSTKTFTTHYSYEDDDPNTPPANDGLLRKLVDPKGNTTTFTYDDRGNVLTVTDANANAAGGTPPAGVTNTYYPNGLLQTATDALGHVTTYTYDAKGNPDTETRTVTITNVDGSSNVVNVVTDRDYNALGQLEKLTDPAGHVTTFEYDTNGNRRFERTTRTSGGGSVALVTETEYDAQDRPVRTWNADNPRGQATRPSSETVYDDNGKVAWTYDALGRGTHQEYDSRGLLIKTTHPDNTFETVTYDADGRRETSTDRRGQVTKAVYDAMGRVKNTIFLGDGSTSAVTLSTTAYDAVGRVWQSTDANNRTTSYSYDAAGRRLVVALPLLQGSSVPSITRYAYDNNGNLRFVTDAKGRVIEHLYDALNRRIQTILPAAPIDLNGDGLLGSNEQSVITSTQTGYDELGRRVSETDASNRTKRYIYDVLGRLRHVVDFAGQDTRFEYDELGNQLSQTDANSHTTSYTYDNAGRRLTRTLPLGQQELLGYDNAGNLASRKDFNGKVTTYGYDAMDRLRYRVPDSSLGEPTVEFTYTANGQRETMRDATGTTIYNYDGRGQLSTKQTPFGTLSYSYYANGSLARTWSSNVNGIDTSYAYDEQNRLATVTDPNLGNTTYSYDEVGNLKQAAYPNAIKHQYTYNVLNRLDLLIDRSPTNTIINCWKYHGTGAGQRTWVEEFDHRTAWYSYDNLGRLKTEAVTGSIQDGKNGNVSYGYDNVGNRLSRTSSLPGIPNQTFGYDANDRLNGDQYDANGNTRIGTTSQPLNLSTPQQVSGTDSYDSENRLTQRNGNNGSVTLLYDGDGNRVQEIVNGQTTSYLVDDRNPTGYAQVVEEIVNGVVNHTYTYGHDLISQDQVDPATNSWHATFYAYDGHGNVRFLTNESGQVTDTYVYDAFGTLITATGTTNNRYRYTGEQFDPALGLYYLRARLLNPLTGRFWTQDSYQGMNQEPGSLHKYLYATSDPANNLDPSGRESLAEISISTSIRSGLVGMAVGAPFRAYNAAMQFRAGVDLGTIAYDASIGVLTDGALGAALPGLGSFAARFTPIARAGQLLQRAAGSVWNATPFVRGRLIEEGILGRLPSTLQAGVKNFPVIDDFFRGVATSIKSIDVTAKTYQNTSSLIYKIMRDAGKLAAFDGAEYGGYQVAAHEVEKRVLVVVVEEGAVTAEQAEALVQATRQARAAYPGVEIAITPMP